MANKPNNPSLWSKAKSLAKQKFDVYPSAYANGWAAKWYKSKGGTWRKAMEGMEIPLMNVGGLFPRFMEEGGEPNGEMALGQMAAVADKMMKLRQFITGEDNLDPWIASKLAVMDHSADAIYDYIKYGAEGDEEEGEEEEDEMEEEEAPMTENELEEMKNGGIPERYRKRGFTKVGVKRQSTRPGKKWMVLAKKGDQYKIVHGGYKGMKDFTQHRNKNRQKKFWSRMGGRDSSKATDPFSPLYWHKRFGTWEDGGQTDMYNNLNINSMNPLFDFIQRAQMGGSQQQDQMNQIIQAYAQIANVSPEEIIGELKKMKPQEQQQALKQMMQAVEQAQGAANQQPMMGMGGGMPCYKCGGSKYQYGGMTDQYGGMVLPAMPVDIYGIPMYGAGGAMRAYVNNPYVEDMMEMAEGGKMPYEIARARFAAAGNLDKMDEYGYMYGGNIPEMKRGGININPANKGKFTAKAKEAGMGVQGFASKVLNAPEGRYSAATRRQANFARNAAKWKKQDGGVQYNVPMKLSQKEIDNLIAQGYNVQYLD